ncbi:MAG: PH domain-containing protein [Ancrocorticia sp.]
MNTATYILRGPATRLYAYLLWALAGVAVISSFGYGVRAFAATALVSTVLALVGWLCYWNPRVILNDDGVTIINPSRTFEVPWEAVESASGKWGLQVTPREHKPIHVWAIPGRAGMSDSFAKPHVEQAVVWDEHSGTENLKVTADRAATIIEMRAAELRAEKATAPTQGATVMTVHLIPLGALSVLAVLAAMLMAL